MFADKKNLSIMFTDSRISIFMEVAAEGSFTKAAKNLGISQPAVSQNISEIEKEVGAQLFARNRNAVSLTSEGRRFKGYAEQILHWYAAAQRAFGKDLPAPLRPYDARRRDLRIGISDDYECYILPCGSEDLDIEVECIDGRRSVRTYEKVAEPLSQSATVLF